MHGIPTSPRLWWHVILWVRGAWVLAREMVGYSAPISEGRNVSVTKKGGHLGPLKPEIGLWSLAPVGHDFGGGQP